MKLQYPVQRSRRGKGQRGYILLTLMLFVSLLAIAAVAIAPSVTFQIKRDREEELIHRGVQYSRAIRAYFKKFGRYPTRLEDLENTNNVRFLRRRYKDPITGKDFKLLHFGEVQLTMGSGITGAISASALSGAAGATPDPGAKPGGFSLGPTSTQTTGQPSQDAAANATDGSSTSSDSSPGAGQGTGTTSGGGSSSSPVFGGGPIVGVVSASKAQTIREFNNKNHYNQWQFIYDPGTDRGGLLNTPAQPPLQNATVNGQNGVPGVPPIGGMGMGTGMGPGNSFGVGMGNGMNNVPVGPQPGAPVPPSPQNQPQQ